MNKTAVKQFAAAARKTLITAVTQRAYACGIRENSKCVPAKELKPSELEQYHDLTARIRAHGFSKTMEEAAFFWFSRLTALRYMEVNGYLQSTNPVFQSAPEAEFRDRILKHCRSLQQELPETSESDSGWADLLLPDHLSCPDGMIARMLTEIPEKDWYRQVQIIGWLYQYYNTECKDKVFSDLRRNIKITAETLPAATQLFTPEWIARCLTENSLGRLWAEGHGKPDHALWNYYIRETEQDSSTQALVEELRGHYRTMHPDSLRVIDPCMGCGHILLAAFDVLMDIYRSCGWSEPEAALSIINNNLFGLDIDRHVYQLAYFSVMMKAREYHPGILEIPGIRPNLGCFADAAGVDAGPFRHADVFGSLMEITLPERSGTSLPDDAMRICRILSQQYDAVITNPPYMGSSSMDPVLSEFVKQAYPDSKSDLFACFIEKCRKLTKPQGFYALLTMQSWMFLLSFEQLRDSLMDNDVVSLVHLGANAFDQGDVGTIVQAAAFVMRKTDLPDYRGTYIDLNALNRPEDKINGFFDPANYYYISKEQFLRIPGHPFAYWASERMLGHFSGEKLGDHAAVRQGMTTSDNERFIRRWYEPAFSSICFHAKDREEAQQSKKRWFPYNKGGGYRKWYGNHEFVVNYEDDGRELQEFHRELNKTRSGGRIKNKEYYFKRAIAWNFIALTPGFRYRPDGFLFDVAGSSLFVEDDMIEYVMAFLCSKVAECFLHILNPTMNVQANDIKSLPYIYQENEAIRKYTQENIALCKADWDSFETSWDFTRHPLLPSAKSQRCGGFRLAVQFRQWEQTCEARFQKLKTNEEALNRLFIDIYGLQEDLTPVVEDRTVTVRRAEAGREIRSLISYAVGCLFGRYAPDQEGIITGGTTGSIQTILPIFAQPVFENDLTNQIIDWLRNIYGDDTLEENLKFIADALGGRGEPREVLQSYLMRGFFADHCKIYQKRPIYWMFSSGRKNAFKALVYLHHWQRTTISELHKDYIPKIRTHYQSMLAELKKQQLSATAGEGMKLRKQINQTVEFLAEISRYEEKLRTIAAQMPEIIPDDGVTANYSRFSDIMEKIKG